MARSRVVFLCLTLTCAATSAPWASAPAVASAAGGGVSRAALPAMVFDLSREYGLDPFLMDSLIRIESDYDPDAVSHRGAMGLMQLMPETVQRLRVSDPFDPEENVRGGLREFRRLLDRYAGILPLALAAYNAGEGAVARYGGVPPFPETRDYVVRIMSLYTGKPYSLGSSSEPRPEVRLVREPGSGTVLITNERKGSSRHSSRASTQNEALRGVLSGGFGSTPR